MTNLSLLNRRVQLAFGSAALLLLVIGALSYSGMVVSIKTNLWVQHTREVLENIQDLRLVWESIASDTRAFVLTGDDSYYESYREDVLRAEKHKEAIRTLTVDNPRQQGQISTLEGVISEESRRAELVTGLRRIQGLAAAAAIEGAEDERIAAEFNEVAGKMQAEEQRLLLLRDSKEKRTLRQLKTGLILGAVLCILVGGAAGATALRDSSARELAEVSLRDNDEKYRRLVDGIDDNAIVEFKLRELNAHLEERVKDRTKALEQQWRVFDATLSSVIDFAYTFDREGRFLYANQPLLKLWGMTLKDVVGKNFFEMPYSHELAERFHAQVQQVVVTGQKLVDETEYTSPTGVSGYYTYFFSPVTGIDGAVELVAGATVDITRRKAAERLLIQMEARYHGLLEAAPDAMVVVDQGGEIVLLNVQAEKQFGYSRDELVGLKVKNIIPVGFAERLIADGTRTAAEALAQQIGTGIELNGLRKDGSGFPIEIMLSPLESEGGILVTAAIRDISVRRAAEAYLMRSVEELNRSNEELERFAYIASHDLQEPLRMVASYTQLLSRRYKGKLDSDADEFISFAVDGANRMQRLIQDLLAYSQVGTKGRDLRDTSSEEALQRALFNLRGAIGDSGAQVTHDPLPTVVADEIQLVQLFQNLVGNAIKYQNSLVPAIHISATRNNKKKWMFAVKDNGLGIEPQYLERIFGMFQRLHKREEFTGTGIGLAICKKIVERHGGSISVESQLGKGSTFCFALTGSEKTS